MLQSLARKTRTALRVYRGHGVHAFAGVFWKRIKFFVAGRLINLTGNHVQVDGCIFDVGQAAILPDLKAAIYFDLYESQELNAITRFLDFSLPVIELGGGIGVVSVRTNKRLHNPDQHIVVEANPHTIPSLSRNRDLNGCQFTILHGAIGYQSSEMSLSLDDNFIRSSVKASGERTVRVPALWLQEVADKLPFGKVNLICDIEGVEVDLVSHEIDLLAAKIAVLIVEVHELFVGRQAIDDMLVTLNNHGFKQVHQESWVHVFLNRGLTTTST